MTVAYDPNNIFARILRGEIPCVKVFEDDKTLAFMDVMPRADGHVLVVSKAPGRNIFDLAPEALSDLILSVQKIALAVKQERAPRASRCTSSTSRRAGRACSTCIST